jgi:hypothetical protein
MNVSILFAIITFSFIGSAIFAAEEVTERAVRKPNGGSCNRLQELTLQTGLPQWSNS